MSFPLVMFMAGGSGIVSLSNQSLSDSDTLTMSGAASCTYTLSNDGDVLLLRANEDLGFPVDAGDWISPKGYAPGAYEVRVDVTSGSLTTGSSSPIGQWLALTTSRSWTLLQSTPGTSSATFTVQIRLGSTVLTSATITMDASVFF